MRSVDEVRNAKFIIYNLTRTYTHSIIITIIIVKEPGSFLS
jgi:hypothetical protein